MKRKTTKDDLVKVLRDRNSKGKYDAIIIRAANNGYHDHKFAKVHGHPEYAECHCPKMQLVTDLGKFPELKDICQQVIDGVYDEPADASDQEEMRGWLIADNASDKMFETLGLKPPTPAERAIKRPINN